MSDPRLVFDPPDPSAVCTVDGDRELTWSEWNDRANRFAAGLGALGVRAGDRVAVRVRTRLEWPVINLGLAKLGCVHVAVNYRLTPPEAEYILRDCAVTAVVLDDADVTGLLDAWAGLDLRAVVSLDALAPDVVPWDDLLATPTTGDVPVTDLAPIIIYTSGTTGRPKGAPLGGYAVPPDPVVIEEYRRSVGFDGETAMPGNRTLVSLPMHHGAGPAQVRGALAGHGMVVMQRRFDPEEALALIERHRVTHWVAVPTMLQRILNLPAETRARYDHSSLRFLQSGAAPVRHELKQQVLAEFGDGVLYEGYGCTEAGMISGARPADHLAKPGTSGKPYRHVSVRVLDEQGRVLGPGETGEIAVHTPVIISGYIGRGPLGPDQLDADGYYHTGDVGHLDGDGYLFIYDRRTDMIIAGGSNVYPAEIEAVLGSHPGVELVAVLGVPHPELGEQAVAVVEPVPGATITEADVLGRCEGRLAKYKWPRRVVFVDHIPLNPMGKILKRELRAELFDRKEIA